VKLAGAHKDSVFSVNVVPRAPFNTYVSGDCDDKVIVWKVLPGDPQPPVDGGAGEEQKAE
jgi:hypothetical protein